MYHSSENCAAGETSKRDDSVAKDPADTPFLSSPTANGRSTIVIRQSSESYGWPAEQKDAGNQGAKRRSVSVPKFKVEFRDADRSIMALAPEFTSDG